ncbi:MAG: VCBS repeat-containing protein [Deltaproteobacteria bacterium]
MRWAVVLLAGTCACATLPSYAPPEPGTVSCGSDGDDVVVANSRVRVRIDRRRGHVESIEVDGEEVAGAERLTGLRRSAEATVRIHDVRSYYARVDTRVVLEDVVVERTYELTAGPYLYVQVSLRARSKAARIDRLAWSLADANVDVGVTAPAMLILEPTDSLGGLHDARWGNKLEAAVEDGRWSLAVRPLELAPNRRLTFGVAVSHGEPERDLRPRPLDEHPFYVGLGLRAPPFRGTEGYTFVNWNRFEDLGALLPVRDVVGEDALIRTGMHLLERVEKDGGWPKTFAWSVYPHADWQAAHVGALLPLLSTWAHLELSRGHSDARRIYDALQGARRILDAAFEDHTEDGVPYVAYSAHKKEAAGGPRGVFNTHARAIHFAASMAEAAMLVGDVPTAGRWRSIVERYHPGTRALLDRLYPGHQDGARLYGWFDYAFDVPRVSTIGGSSYYPRASMGGIATSYEAAGTGEPWFIDVVDEQSRVSSNPLAPPSIPLRWAPHAMRLARAFPPALAFLFGDRCRVMRFEAGQGAASTATQEIDFDGDGAADRLRIDRTGASALAFVSTGAGAEEVWAHFTPADVPIATGDFDGDGRTDLFAVLRDPKAKRLHAWVATSDGQRFSPSIWAVMPSDVAWSIADVDGDGRDDVVLDDGRALLSTATDCPRVRPTPTSANVILVGPAELLAFSRDGRVGPHDPTKYIHDPVHDRWIRSNNPFEASWVRGFWEEVPPAEVPSAERFEVRVEGDARWAAHREGTQIWIASDRATTIEVDGAACARVRRYQGGEWGAPTMSKGARAAVRRKDLVTFELDPAGCQEAGAD